MTAQPPYVSEIPWSIDMSRLSLGSPKVTVTLNRAEFDLDYSWCVEHLDRKEGAALDAAVLFHLSELIYDAAVRAQTGSVVVHDNVSVYMAPLTGELPTDLASPYQETP